MMIDNKTSHSNIENDISTVAEATQLKIEKGLQQLLNDLQLDDAPAGGALAVYHAGSCIAQASVGMAQQNVPWQATTLALNFSTGKGVLATLAHVLVSQQLLDYDQTIASYWPAFAVNGKADITLRKLMSHQAGLFAINTIEADIATLLDWDKMVGKVAAMAITKPDNAEAYDSAYSALVYGWILGALIEKVTDMSLAAALRHYLTEPLGIADSCYFGVPAERVNEVAKLAKDFTAPDTSPSPSQPSSKRRKPTLRADSIATLATYQKLASYGCWQRLAMGDKTALTSSQINAIYFDPSSINASNYKLALFPASKQPIDYYDQQTLQAVMPAVNGVASAQALATIYAMLANGGVWQGKILIDSQTFEQLSIVQQTGMDAVMPARMNWRLGYHRLFSVCKNSVSHSNNPNTIQQGFGHMGYNGSVAWCEPTRQLSFAFVHNFDVTMLNDIRQFALTEAVLALFDQ